MIAYDLQCGYGHSFEGWFEDETAYREQKKGELIACPVCNDTHVSRIPSTFAIKSSRAAMPAPSPRAEIAEIGKRILDFVEKNFEDVGCNFAKEALKMHYGVEKPRNIRGVSTAEEEKTLRNEGIEFFKIPASTPPDTDS